MKFHWISTAASVACLGLLLTQTVEAQRQREYQSANSAAEMAGETLVSYNSFETCGCDDCDSGGYGCDSGGCCGCSSSSGGGLGLGNGFLDRPGQFFAGADYIYARASFSEALAYVISNPASGVSAQFIEHDFDYESSFRVHGGYQFCDCGGAITFDYGQYRSGSGFSATEGVNDEFLAPYEIEVDGANNETLSGNAFVDIDSYGLSFSRTIPLGSPLSCGDCDCGDTCCDCDDTCGGSCWCPAWDITWSAGLRFAEAGWSRGATSTNSTTNEINGVSTTRLDFEGAGARFGLLGRRYFGKRGLLSAYAKGDISVLVGNMDIITDRRQRAGGILQPAGRIFSNSARRVIPITEIEAGVSAHVGDHITLSSGYFLAAWHDLGMRDTYIFENPDSGGLRFPISHFDDANILGFDGFFARAQIAY